MIKKIIYMMALFTLALIFDGKVYAYSQESASISASSTKVYLGNTVIVTVRTNYLWGTYIVYSENHQILNGDEDSSDITSDSFTKSFKFQAISVGTTRVCFSNSSRNSLANPTASDENPVFFNDSRCVQIEVIKKDTSKPIEINKTYNKNNNLKSLGVDGYELNPAFNKDTLEYTIELTPGTEKINVKAVAEHNSATIKGVGEVQVSEGVNTINIVVTAENGNEKTYKITANMEEKDPIEVEINGKKYRVIKKRELIGTKDGYKEDTVKISDFDIPALYNEVTKITLVGLKNSDGNIGLYAYDSKTGKYSIYKEYEFNRMNLYIHEDKKSPYTKKKIKINGEEVIAYKVEDLDDYYLIYATNTMTGHEGYYLYDVEENSVQRYNTYMIDKLMKEKDKYLSIVLVLSCVCFLAMLFLLIEVNKIKKMKF